MENTNPSAAPTPKRANKPTAAPTSNLPPTQTDWAQRWREVAEWSCSIDPPPDLDSPTSPTAKQLTLIFQALDKAWQANNPTTFQGAFRRLQQLFPHTSLKN